MSKPSQSRLLAEKLAPQIHFVSGKGGVGKSVFSCALALHFRREGKNVLLAQVNAADSHSKLLDLDEVQDDVHEVEPGLYVVNTRPEQAMREYALMTLKFEALYRATFENRLTKRFLRFIPSLAELTMLGKLWFHAEEKDKDQKPRFDKVIIDAPSTGHGLGFMRISQIVRDIVHVGPMYEKANEMAQTFEAPDRSALHVVTLPEEMPTNETLSFLNALQTSEGPPPATLLLNAWPNLLFNERFRDCLVSQTPAHREVAEESTLLDIMERRCTREELALTQRQRLEEEVPDIPLWTLPHTIAANFGRAEVERLAQVLASQLETA